MSFYKKSLAFAKLAIVTNLEYRVNYFTDVVVQPVVSALVELCLWSAVFTSAGINSLAGFSREHYLAYAIWASFVARITSNWMYEFKMITEIESGAVNAFLSRPASFFHYYLSQFLGYKLSTIGFSLFVPLVVAWYFDLPTDITRLPAVLALLVLYVFFLHILSFTVASLAFRLTKVSSLTVAKNLSLWVLSGELFPLDLLPEPLRAIFLALPFSSAVYIPVGFLTHRIGVEQFCYGALSTACGIVCMGLVARYFWQSGVRRYTGTGA